MQWDSQGSRTRSLMPRFRHRISSLIFSADFAMLTLRTPLFLPPPAPYKGTSFPGLPGNLRGRQHSSPSTWQKLTESKWPLSGARMWSHEPCEVQERGWLGVGGVGSEKATRWRLWFFTKAAITHPVAEMVTSTASKSSPPPFSWGMSWRTARQVIESTRGRLNTRMIFIGCPCGVAAKRDPSGVPNSTTFPLCPVSVVRNDGLTGNSFAVGVIDWVVRSIEGNGGGNESLSGRLGRVSETHEEWSTHNS